MNPILVASIVLGYIFLLMLISYLTSRKSDAVAFYTANKNSKWYLVAFGMIGASLSGVTFLSVPGEVANSNFYYFQVVLGYLLGYLVIGKVLMPLYYKLNIISIYSYLDERFGTYAYKTGASFFLLSRVVGASFRLFLVAGVLQIFFFDSFKFPFWVSVLCTLFLIWLYTYRGGMKTIVWTDTLQTFFMLGALIASIFFIKEAMSLNWGQLWAAISEDERTTIFNWEWKSSSHFGKQFLSGCFIAIVMTGLDQDMMQKNLTCRNLREAQRNMFWFCVVLVIANFLFLSLGVLLYQYADFVQIDVPTKSDDLFPFLAFNYFTGLGGIIFLLGIIAAAYSSADSALTALTTSFCIDIMEFKKENFEEKKTFRRNIHLAFSTLLFFIILLFQAINDRSVINAIFIAAGYTYGPILGLFSFGIFTRWQVNDKWVPIVCVLSPFICYFINRYSETILNGYKFGFELLILNGILVFFGLFLIRQKKHKIELPPIQ